MKQERIIRDLGFLHPLLRKRAEKGFLSLQAAIPGLCAFETLRTPERQAFLYAQGRTSPGHKVTKARPWHSWHNFGLAFDCAVLAAGGQWSWVFDTGLVRARLIAEGLEPGPSFEACHFQLTGGLSLGLAKDIFDKKGVSKLWDMVTENAKRPDHDVV